MLTAEDLERVYAIYTSAIWRGDRTRDALESWFRVHWVEAGPCEPDADAAAVSPHGAGGRGIYWHECSNAILGFVPGKSGCYLVRNTESLPVAADPLPTRLPLPARPRPVAHFQSGTGARHLTARLSQPLREKS